MNMTRAWRSSRAFTLIELLVVISIISLLASIVFASLAEARTKARDSALISFLLEVEKAVNLYAANNNGSFPPFTTTCLYCDTIDYDGSDFSLALQPYLKFPTNMIFTTNNVGRNRAYAAVESGGAYGLWYFSQDGFRNYKVSVVGIKKPGHVPTSLTDIVTFDASCNGKVASVVSTPAAKDWLGPEGITGINCS